MNIRPTHDRIVVQREQAEEKIGSLFVPTGSREAPQQGVVVSTGLGRYDDRGKLVPISVTAGQRILFGKYAGSEVEVEGKTLLIIKDDEVLGILE